MKNTSTNNKGLTFLKDLGFFLLLITILVPVAFGAVYIPWSILKFHKIIWSASIYTASLFKLTSFVLWVVGVFVVIATMIKYGFFSFTKLVNKSNRAESDAYGNSRWQTDAEMSEKYGCYAWSKLNNTQAEGIVVRSFIKNNELYVSTIKEQHCLNAGAPGTGKSTLFLGPSIQMNAQSKTKATMVINDLKGELYDVHAPTLRAAGYDVIKFDLGHPSDPQNTHFNPLSLIWELYQDYMANGKADSELIDQVSLLINEVALLICPESTGENAQWAQGAQGIVTAVIWGMLEDGLIPEYDMTSEKFTIAQISNIVNRQRSYLEDFLKHRSRKSPVFDHAGNILDNPSEKTVASYLSTLSTNLKVFLEEGVKRITAFTDFDITVMNRRPTALFIVLPERQQTRNVVGTMLLQQIYNQVTYEVSKTSDKSVFRPIYFFLDEFGNLPKMKNLPRQIALGRSQGIFYILVVQADSQIEAVYGEHDARTITNNAQVHTHYRHDNYTFNVEVKCDNSPPIVTCPTGLKSGNYTNKKFTVKADDNNGSGVKTFYMETPLGDIIELNSTPQDSISKEINPSDYGSQNGAYKFYAVDKLEHRSSDFIINYDNTAPTIKCEVENGGYTKNAFTVKADDNNGSGIKTFYMKDPNGNNSLVEGTTKTIQSPMNGTYEFYAIDEMGYRSSTYKIHYDNIKPVIQILKNGTTVGDGTWFSKTDKLQIKINETYTEAKLSLDGQEAQNCFRYFQGAYFDKRLSEEQRVYYGKQADCIAAIKKDEIDNKITKYQDYSTGANGSQPHSSQINALKIGEDYWIYNENGSIWAFASQAAAQAEAAQNSAAQCTFEQSFILVGTNGTYTISVKDLAGNEESRTIHFDSVAPDFTLTANDRGIDNGGSTNTNVKIEWTDPSATLKIDGKDIESNQITNVESTGKKYYIITAPNRSTKKYTIALTDVAGNVTQKTVTIDTEPPIGSLKGANNNSETKNDVSFTWNEAGASATLNNNPYNKDTLITTEGTYTIVLSDALGNRETYTFKIDRTAPTFTLTTNNIGIVDGGITNTNVKIEWTEPSAILRINNSIIPTNGSTTHTINKLTNATAKYTITLTDVAGNVTQKTVTIDTKPPVGSLSSVVNEGATNKDVTFTWDEPGATATLNGDAYTSGTPIVKEGKYTIVLSDAVGNKSTYTFEIDKTGPVGTFKGLNAFGYSNTSVYFTWTESDATAKLNKDDYSSGAEISQKGNHTIILTDHVGNKTEYSFIIDKDKPILSVKKNSTASYTGVLLNAKDSITFSYTDDAPVCVRIKYSSGLEIANSFDYINDTKYYDVRQSNPILYSSKPSVTSYILAEELKSLIRLANWSPQIDGQILESEAEYAIEGSNYIVFQSLNHGKYIFFDEKRATEFISTYINTYYIGQTKRLSFALEGSFIYQVTDIAGNSSEFKFTIDQTAPIGTLSGVENGGITNQIVRFTTEESDCIIQLNGTAYQANTNITAERIHTIVLTDKAGNSSTYTFTIDKTPPTGTLKGVEKNSVTKNNVTFTWSEAGATATLNGNAYASATSIEEEGTYTIILTDVAGNSSTYTFEIDKTAPTGRFSSAGNMIDGALYFGGSIAFSWEENGALATLNGNNYPIGTPITLEGEYEILLTDIAGNIAKYLFYLDTTPYTDNYDYLYKNFGKHNNQWFETYEYIYNEKQSIYNIKTYWSFTNRTDAYLYAYYREKNIVEYYSSYSGGAIICAWSGAQVDGFDVATSSAMIGQPYSIYYSLDSKSKTTAYFDLANLESALDKWAADSVSNRNIPSVPAIAFPGNELISAQTLYRESNGLSVFFIRGESYIFNKKPHDVTLTVNGVDRNYSDPITTGMNFVIETDRAGNELAYIVILDATAPGLQCRDGANNPIADYDAQFAAGNKTIYISKYFRLYIVDDFDEQALLTVTKNGISSLIFGEFYDFSESGEYNVSVRDLAGNTASYTVLVSLIEPTISTEEVLNERGVLLGFNYQINKELSFNNLYSITLERFDNTTESYLQITQDGNGNAINTTTFTYFLNMSGEYKLTIIDSFGREITNTFNFEKDAPTGTIWTGDKIQLKSGSATTKVVYFTWPDKSNIAYINELEYTQGAFITADGEYTIRLDSPDGLYSTIYTFVIDNQAPVGTLSGVENNGYTNAKTIPVTMSWSDETEKGTIGFISKNNAESVPYEKNAQITADGSYTITLQDRAGNISKYSFEIKTTPISVTILTASKKALQNGSITNESFSFTWNEPGASATVNGENYTSKQLLSESGQYAFIIIDRYGSTSFYNVTIDKIPPTGEFSGLNEYMITNQSATFTWEELGATATLNGNSYSSGTPVEEEGLYTIILSDAVGNKSTYTFEIDKTAPVGTLSSVENGGITKYAVYFSWRESSASATLDGNQYTSNSIITEEGEHTIHLTDIAGNIAIYTFIIDITPPAGSFSETGNIVNGIIYFNHAIAFTWSEPGVTAKLNKKEYSSESLISEEGYYELVLTDAAQNTTSYIFNVIFQAPTPRFTTNYLERDDILYFSQSFSIYWSQTATAILNNEPYEKNQNITEEGLYSFMLTDLASNTFVATFIIDKTVPTGSFSSSGNLYYEIHYFNTPVSFISYDTNAVCFFDNEEYDGKEISAEGQHTFTLTDFAGNTSKYNFVIDTISPQGAFNATPYSIIDDIMYFNSSLSFTCREYGVSIILDENSFQSNHYISENGRHLLKLIDRAGNETSYTFIIDRTAPRLELSINGTLQNGIYYINSPFSVKSDDADLNTLLLNEEDYISESIIDQPGEYIFSAIDYAGNISKLNVIFLDKAPTGTLIGVENGGKTGGFVSFTWNDPSATATLDGLLYRKNTQISSVGLHSIELVDIAGNSTTYTFEIDRTIPTGTLIGVENNGRTKENVSFTWEDWGASATLNGDTYNNGDMISTEGTYLIILTNNSNGKIAKYTFEIDKTAPIGTLSGVENGGITNTSVSFTWTETGAIATLDNIEYKKYTAITTEGKHEIILMDALGNQRYYTFEIDKTAPTGYFSIVGIENNGVHLFNSEVAFMWFEDSTAATLDDNIYDGTPVCDEGTHRIVLTDVAGNSTTYTFKIDKTAPIGTLKGVENGGITNTSVSFTWTETGVTVTLNGEDYSKNSQITAEGIYTIVITDLVGNINLYTFEIDKTAPEIFLSESPTNTINSIDYFNLSTTIFLLEDSSVLTINGVEIETDYYIFNIEGTFEICLTDRTGNSIIKTIVIDMTAPIGTLSGVENDGITNTNVTFTWSETGVTATLNGDKISKNSQFSIEGTYTIILTDTAGNSTTYTFEIDKTAPIGTLSGVENGGITNANVTFTWDEESALATLNGDAYTSATSIEEEGTYTIILTDVTGNSTTYTFEIDMTAPIGALSGVENGGITKTSVTFSWTESGVTVSVNGDSYSKGNYISAEGSYTIILTDAAGNSTTYTFEIDKTAPIGTLSGVENDGITNTNVTFTWDEESALATLNGNACPSGTSIEEEGIYTIILSDTAGNSTTYTFEIDMTAPVASFTQNYVERDGIYYFDHTTAVNWNDKDITATLNDSPIAKGSFISTQGENIIIRLVDRAGNVSEYTIFIDSKKPTFDYIQSDVLLGNGEPKITTFENGGRYVLNEFTLPVNAAFSVSVNNKTIEKDMHLSTPGEYIVTLTSITGQTSTFTIVISAPTESAQLSNIDVFLIVFAVLIVIGIIIALVIYNTRHKKLIFKRK